MIISETESQNDMKTQRPFHFILFAIYPILSLYAHNIEQLPLNQVWTSTGIVLAATLILFLLLRLVLRNFTKSALVTSAMVMMFFTFGHVSDFTRFMVLLLFIIGGIYLIRTRRDFSRLTQIVNWISVCLIIVTLAGVGMALIKGGRESGFGRFRPEIVKPQLSDRQTKNLPDIYFIMLDGYARSDILDEIYRYNNSEFLDRLRQMGFRIADSSHTNYCQTLLSLSSTFNMIYLDSIAAHIGYNSTNRRPLMDLIRDSYVFDFAKQYGYKIIAFSSGYSGTEIRNTDYYLGAGFSLNEFENALINNTPIPKILKHFPIINQYNLHRQDVNFAFDKLADLPETGTPRFVFAPIVTPHPPFVFGPNGEEIDYDRMFEYSDGSHYMILKGATPFEYLKNYRDQLHYASKRVLFLVNQILSRPGKKPIIIIQADHGPGFLLFWEKPEYTFFRERLTILNAYYLPDGGDSLIYDGITPVNSFRTIFNYYFGTDFKRLEDKSYFSRWSRPYQFMDVTEDVMSDAPPKYLHQ